MNKNALVWLAVCAGSLLFATQGFATPAVYKCTKPDGGVVFSPTPCGANAKEVDTSRALMHGTSPNIQGVSDRAAMSRIDGDCANRDRGISDNFAGQYAAADREIARLHTEMDYTANNFAGATRDNGIRSQLSASEDRRVAIGGSERGEHAALQKECDEERRAESKRQADRDAAKPNANP